MLIRFQRRIKTNCHLLNVKHGRGFVMKLYYSIFFILLISSSQSWAEDKLEIIVNAPRSTPEDAELYLTGNTEELCHWKRPDCLLLKKVGVKTYKAYLGIPENNAKIQFKITRGSWDQEAADGESRSIPNFVINPHSSDKSILINLINWKDKSALGVTGNLRILHSFYSPELNNFRKVSIWFPAEYEKNPKQRFPVLYMHDGQNVFDPYTSNTGIDWGADETMTELISQNKITSAIVVAVDCTKDRESEYNYNERGQLYADFLIHTLKPFIDSNLRTLPERESTFTMGSSMGALISLSLLWTHPEVFSGAAGLSMAAFYDDQMIIQLIKSIPAPVLPIKIYFDHGDQGDDFYYAPTVEILHSALLNAGVLPAAISYQVFPYSNHNELDWSRRLHIPLNFLLPSQKH